MKRNTTRCYLFIITGVFILLQSLQVQAHPGWGIQVNSKGEILFADVGNTTIWKLLPDGNLSALVADTWTHSIHLDDTDNLYYGKEEYRGEVGPYNSFWKLSAEGSEKVLIAPVLNRDWFLGNNALVDSSENIYYFNRSGILKRNREGEHTLLAEFEKRAMTTMVMGPGNAIYVTNGDTLQKVLLTDGHKTTLAKALLTDPADDPFFPGGEFNDVLGFDVAENGDIYIAYFGNRRLLKIKPDGTKTEIYHSKAPWSPVGVTIHKGNLYLLETAYNNDGSNLGPRVRKKLPNGRFKTLVRRRQQIKVPV